MILSSHPSRQTKEKALGYWDGERLHPKQWVDESWDPTERDLIIAYLQNGESKFRWRGCSWCRFCECRNGSQCLTDGTYIWPQGFTHYLIEHGVKPPQEFIDHVLL